jgi:hypothetical protein
VQASPTRGGRDRHSWVAVATVTVGLFVPLMVAALGYWATASNQEAQARRDFELAAQQSRRDFELEAARIVLNAENPTAIYNKARALKALFPGRLSPTFATQFEPARFETYSTARSKRELLSLLLAHRGQEAQILAWWAQLFPADAAGDFAFLLAFAEGALTRTERADLTDAITDQVEP